MNIFKRAGNAVEHIWASYPFIGIIVLFIGIGLAVFEGAKARQVAGLAATTAQNSNNILNELKRTQKDTIAAKDNTIDQQRQRIVEKDMQITTTTVIIGELYNDALALQQQVISLGGKPKSIPVTFPTSQPTQKVTPLTSQSSSILPSASPKDCKLGISAAPLNVVQIQICLPPPKG